MSRCKTYKEVKCSQHKTISGCCFAKTTQVLHSHASVFRPTQWVSLSQSTSAKLWSISAEERWDIVRHMRIYYGYLNCVQWQGSQAHPRSRSLSDCCLSLLRQLASIQHVGAVRLLWAHRVTRPFLIDTWHISSSRIWDN